MRLNQIDRESIVEIGKNLSVKMPDTSHLAKKQKLIDLIESPSLIKHRFWGEKRHNIPYLAKSFEEAWNIAFPKSKSTGAKSLDYSKYEKSA